MTYQVSVFNRGSLHKVHKIEANSSSNAIDTIEARHYGGKPEVRIFKNKKGEISQTVRNWHGCCFEARQI